MARYIPRLHGETDVTPTPRVVIAESRATVSESGIHCIPLILIPHQDP